MSRLDVFPGMAFSNVVMFAIITATAATLGRTHHLSISPPAQAAEALRRLGGQIGSYVFALGFIARTCSRFRCLPARTRRRWPD